MRPLSFGDMSTYFIPICFCLFVLWSLCPYSSCLSKNPESWADLCPHFGWLKSKPIFAGLTIMFPTSVQRWNRWLRSCLRRLWPSAGQRLPMPLCCWTPPMASSVSWLQSWGSNICSWNIGMMITAIATSRKYPEKSSREIIHFAQLGGHPGLPLKLTGPRRDYPVDAVVTNCTWDAEPGAWNHSKPNHLAGALFG